MSKRPIKRATPDLEPLETRQVPGAAAAHPAAEAAAHPAAHPAAEAAAHPAAKAAAHPTAEAAQTISKAAGKPNYGYLVYRITNPDRYNNKVTPIVGNVLVQATQPVAGQTYNLLWVVMRNGAAQTFNASDNLQVSVFGEHQFFPVLTGNETSGAGQWRVFYVLSKKYYPLANQVTDGFVFKYEGASSVVIPGPAAIYLRLKYNPATFDNVLHYIVTQGPGVQGGYGYQFGLPITNVTSFVNSNTHRNDFAGLF